ncbi:MAG: Glu/Leu/Phe/Val dehydrogenase [Deltaproteobacteria bacterium]|nr:MAG: Glu/Leu/Phe/Val dehydrogenase [Deltaproteobacteria bacterium]
MTLGYDTPLEDFLSTLAELGLRRASFHLADDGRTVVPSHPGLSDLARAIQEDGRDFAAHEGIFMEVGRSTGLLMTAFVHDTRRGQAQGGLRYWNYPTIGALVRDGLRLSRGMTRKNALAGLWWGGGKGIVARAPGDAHLDPGYRAEVYTDYAEFVTSLRGCYVTAEDAGTTAADMAIVHAHTRFATCIPPAVGGSGNPSPATARGVVCAMEAALAETGRGDLRGKIIAVQGAGNVAGYMIDLLVERGVERVVATEIDPHRHAELTARWKDAPVELRLVEPNDASILAEPADLLAPCALGGVLGPATIPTIRAPIVCGAANNQLLDEHRDGAALHEHGIVYVPDFVANRMGIVHCANEQYGYVKDDPAYLRHFDADDPGSIQATTRRVLALARDEGISTAEAADRLADEAAAKLHPIWGHRGRAIIAGLVSDGWAAAAATPS